MTETSGRQSSRSPDRGALGGQMVWTLLLLLGCREHLTPDVEPPSKNPSEAWNQVLGQVVTDDGYVDYDKLESKREALDNYVAWLGTKNAMKGKMTKDRHALFLNAYNAFVMYQVLERGRPASVLEPSSMVGPAGTKFFVMTEFSVGSVRLSLSEIEHEQLRWRELDVRDHAAMNCASKSCPPMRNRLYTEDGLAGQLRDQMRAWMADDERGVRVVDGKAVFNPIFDWFARDFHFFSAGLSICEIAVNYTTGPKKRELMDVLDAGCPHEFFEYDWSLNDASPGK